ncbi:MAG TPA: ATP-binding cassette domain-containing protein, partial [Turneriella sp.]|nr:ATP-binding cassette domain-containing protein [Turneriella sp.]
PEGSGKSQIMSLIMARQVPHAGSIYFQGVPLEKKSDEAMEMLRFSIGYVAENLGLINNLSVLENILLPLRYHTALKDDELYAAADLWLERYDLKHKEKIRPVSLSASESMRTALLRALIVEPRILLLDGIFDGGCPLASRYLMDLLFEDIKLRGISFIITTYFPFFFDGRDLQFLLLYRGRPVFQGALADMRTTDNEYAAQYRTLNAIGPMRSFNET